MPDPDVVDSEFVEVNNGLMQIWSKRQQKIVAIMPRYARIIIVGAVAGFVLSTIIQIVVGLIGLLFSPDSSTFSEAISNALKPFGNFNLTLGGIISLILSLFSNVVMWTFVLWSLTFVPFVAYNSFKVSQAIQSKVTTRPFKWVQLYAATLLPMVIFAIAWNSTPNKGGNIEVQVGSWVEVLALIVGTAFVAGLLYFVNRFVPSSSVAIKLSILSAIIYASLYFAYGQGYSVVSFFVLFGILSYLMLQSGQIEEMGRRMIVYDFDTNIAQKLDAINARRQDLQVARDEIKLSESEVEQKLKHQFSDIQSKRIDLVNKVNKTQVEILEQKIDMLTTVFDAVSEEFSTRVRSDFHLQLEDIKEKAKTLSPQDLYKQMDEIMTRMNPILEGFPESLGELRIQLLKAADDLEKQTQLLLDDSSRTNKENKDGKK